LGGDKPLYELQHLAIVQRELKLVVAFTPMDIKPVVSDNMLLFMGIGDELPKVQFLLF